ncbi:uncharacterized protein LOC142224755 [Haematobia irritans]|uniref:uncharacterized protein LOC142224754 n=1 Tax=Haematobia irritans TaxID=7368 RepID=UPI003F4F849B
MSTTEDIPNGNQRNFHDQLLFQQNTTPGALEISAASVKLPQFWTSCPEAWFIHSEIQFANKGITQSNTKYEHIVTALPEEVVMTVLDFIQNPPSDDRYERIKQILIERHTISEHKRLDKILSNTEIGDRKPSEFFRSLSLLAGTNFGPDFLTKLWIRKLPKKLSVALTASNLSNSDQLTKLADNLWEVMQEDTELASIKQTNSGNANSNNLETMVNTLAQATNNLCEGFKNLSLEVSAMRRNWEDNQRQSRSFRLNRGRSRSRSRGWLCKFHYRYGENAIKCEQPCSFERNFLPLHRDCNAAHLVVICAEKGESSNGPIPIHFLG